MSKRSFEEFSTTSLHVRYQSALSHAETLLKAAQSLKQDLERLGNRAGSLSHETILSTLKHHNAQVLPATNALSQHETCLNKKSEQSHKVRKVEPTQRSSNGQPVLGLLIPYPEALSKWTLEDIPVADTLPPLPPALDPVLEKASRTHAGVAGPLHEMSYERLEWIGDAYLYLASSALIYQTFPNLSPGRCSQLRERLVKNETLSLFTSRYNIDKLAHLPAEFQPQGKSSQTGHGSSASRKERKKILGDLLEAYTAAVILGDADGLSRVIPWLKAIWATTLKQEIRDEYETAAAGNRPNPTSSNTPSGDQNMTQGAPKNLPPKVLLSQAIGTKGVTISYREDGKPTTDKRTGLPWFTIAAYYDGLGEMNQFLGRGGGLSKSEAGNKAAANALKDKDLMKRLKKRKEEVNAALVKP